jgi:hypothetical protein
MCPIGKAEKRLQSADYHWKRAAEAYQQPDAFKALVTFATSLLVLGAGFAPRTNQNYFIVFDSSAAALGRIEDSELR